MIVPPIFVTPEAFSHVIVPYVEFVESTTTNQIEGIDGCLGRTEDLAYVHSPSIMVRKVLVVPYACGSMARSALDGAYFEIVLTCTRYPSIHVTMLDFATV